MMVTVTAATTTGEPLDQETMARVIEGCEAAEVLEAAKNKVCK